MKPFPTNYAIGPWIMFTVMLTASSCVTAEISEKALWENEFEQIQRGISTKNDILSLLGPPRAILKKEDLQNVDIFSTKDDWFMVQAIEKFKPFSHVEKFTEKEMIYYYTSTKVQTLPTYFYWIERGEKNAFVTHLWVLINETSGIVTDFSFRKEERTSRTGDY